MGAYSILRFKNSKKNLLTEVVFLYRHPLAVQYGTLVSKTIMKKIKTVPNRHEIIRKKEKLDKVTAQLKREFIGIDKVIDEITDAISSWFIFPEIQEKPVVINLWGLTGVGKTSLVKRLVELLSFEKKYFRFDMGEVSDNKWAIKGELEEIYEGLNGLPVVIGLDEFQHAKTLSENGMEVNNPATRIVWDLLDSGMLSIVHYERGINEIPETIKQLLLCVKMGVKVKNGVVISERDLFVKIMKLKEEFEFTQKESEKDESRFTFLSESFRDQMYRWVKLKFENSMVFNKYLDTMNAQRTIEYLNKIYMDSYADVLLDCTKAVVFVMGNLDEAYSMSNDFNPDMSADDFYQQSLKINITNIKNVLRRRFRNEQIARLGNIHVIYPAFSNHSYQKIIKSELNSITKTIKRNHQLHLEFDNSINEVIYREGVYPTQGTRPLFTTIHQIVRSKLSKIICFRELNCQEADRVIISYNNELINFSYFEKKTFLKEFSEKMILNLEVLRKEKKDDMQAIVAVHESGHAIVASLLMRILPERIFSSTVDTETAGFVFFNERAKYTSKKDILNILARILGGYAAEKIVYGEENVTLGSEGDIKRATEFAIGILKECGMGKIPAKFALASSRSNYFICNSNEEIEKEGVELIKNALVLAEKVLEENKFLLLKISDYLSDHRSIEKEELKKIIIQYSTYPVNAKDYFITEGREIFYRNKLKELLEEKPIASSNKSVSELQLANFSLNKLKQNDSQL